MDFEYSEKCRDHIRRVAAFMDREVYPNENRYHAEIDRGDRWQPLELIEELKVKAKAEGLVEFVFAGNFRSVQSRIRAACRNDGPRHWAAEVFNCSAPDTGNMEVLHLYGTEEQKETWLKPLLNGEIRSCFAMTEPDVASSDATNIRASIKADGDDYVLNGRKWWSTGAGDARCKLAIFMGKTDENAAETSAAIDDTRPDGRGRRKGRTNAERFRL